MQADHLTHLCAIFDLGTPVAPVSRVFGGFHHTMWRLDTQQGSYAIKQLCADTDLNKPGVVHHFNVSEQVADTFSRHGVPAMVALRREGAYLHRVENTGYLIFPWTEAQARDRREIDETHALRISQLLATMHLANIQVSGVKAHEFEPFVVSKASDIISRARQCALPWAAILQQQEAHIIRDIDAYNASADMLDRHLVISHGDLDQKNVLWDHRDAPLIIDWESAQRLNPTYEILMLALDWGGISSSFDTVVYKKILLNYQHLGSVIEPDMLRVAYQRIVGDWLVWLLYVVACYLEEPDAEQRRIQAEEIDFVLPTIYRLRERCEQLLATAGSIGSNMHAESARDDTIQI